MSHTHTHTHVQTKPRDCGREHRVEHAAINNVRTVRADQFTANVRPCSSSIGSTAQIPQGPSFAIFCRLTYLFSVVR
jgi:hypothetical protein